MSEKSFPERKKPGFQEEIPTGKSFLWTIKKLLQFFYAAALYLSFYIAGSVFQQFVDLGEDLRHFSHSAFADVSAGEVSAGRTHKINVP